MRRFVTVVVFSILILAIFPVYTRFKVAAAPVPPGVHLAGLDLSDLKNPAEIRQHLDRIYTEPIAVYFADRRLVLRPQDVDFHVDVDQMVAEAGDYLDGAAFMDIAVREALGVPQRRRDVPIRFTLNADALRAWLSSVAAEHNSAPQGARVLPPTDSWVHGGTQGSQMAPGFVGSYAADWTWLPGTPGYELDMEASIPALIASLTRVEDRDAHLVLAETPAAPASMADLERALDSYLSSFPGFAAVYVHDLQNDTEANVDADVSFSGMSTLKIAIVAAIMHQLENGIAAGDPVSAEIGQWIDFALGESNNYAANLLLRQLGGGETGAGARRFTEFMRRLGFTSTYMQSAYDVEVQLAEIPTPGNQRTDWNTNPDNNLQSTPAEMGRVLSAIYECALGRGLLLEVYGDKITPDECTSILFYLDHDEFRELLWAGLPKPEQARIVHKHGFAFESHSDVALIWGPTGPYVLSVFLYRRGWMDWGTSNSTMKNVSRLVWNFFEFQREQGAPAAGPPLELPPPPGYVPIGAYIPAGP